MKAGIFHKRYAIGVLTLALFWLIAGCGNADLETTRGEGEASMAADITPLITEFERLGYYKYTDADQLPAVKKDSISAGYVFGWEETNRDFHADAEDLAEGGVGQFLQQIEPFLTKENVPLTNIRERIEGYDYEIEVNGKGYIMYDLEDQEKEDIWELTTKRAFAMVNELLQQATSEARVYALYGGNDQRAVFLTTEMFALVQNTDLIEESEKPITP
ncbi:hypothetical protein FHS18_003902 [Paenibacillus phyllosphaerae]|uniref:Uncharacterized protein n=1 Tax=Paenibacillus phyllosphaerae TaxID=274593 RepID=A0A7W5B0G9_9BACL|nr:hypothetical protein [Paenibacillus phyllosphaerae]MBB3111834.1 hypothetical protein [Paenibacillus phyllosphaerae]